MKRSTAILAASLATLLGQVPSINIARADIFQWEYINPANPSLGKQQSATLTPDGAGAYAGPGTNLTNRDLTKAYLIGADLSDYYDPDFDLYYTSDLSGANLFQADLTGANLSYASLTNVNFSQANLFKADFYAATVTGANFSGAEVRGAWLSGITPSQLYSTASYQAHDLTGIVLQGNSNVAGASFAAQNLSNSGFYYAILNNANFSQANLTNAYLAFATLTGANLTGAQVRNADFSKEDGIGGLTPAQLYSTASYQAHDLTGISLGGNNLAGASFVGQNLAGAGFGGSTLTNANLSQANLTSASFFQAKLAGANLSGAQIRGANFTDYGAGGITKTQLYSTASYQAHDLSGIGLDGNVLTGGSFVGQKLVNARFSVAALSNANFSQANLTGANLYGANLINANLNQANLNNANFYYAILGGANLTGADVRGADFLRTPDPLGDYGTGITVAQLYSTASYQAHDLSGIGLASNDLDGVNLSGQNLTNANFSAEYDSYYGGTHLINANLSGADARGASFQYARLDGANTSNLIQSDGHIAGLDLKSGTSLTVRNYHGPVPKVVVEQHLVMDATGILRLVFDADQWDSTISFAPGIPVTLAGGILDLSFAAGVDPATQGGRTFDLFDWTGVTRTGFFTVANSSAWNLSQLYTTGEITFGAAAIPSWNVDASGNWSNASNWTGGVPNGIDAVANFGAAITSPRTVTVDAPRTVGTINFSSPVAYTIAGSSAITLDVSTGQAAINVTSGSHTISAPLLLNDTTAVSVAAGQTLSVRHVRRAPAATAGLAVNSGTLRVLSGAGPNDPAGTSVVSTLTVASAAVLDLTNNSAVIDYTGAVGTIVGDVRQHLQSGRLTSSSADATHRLGYGDNVLLSKTSFGGITVDASSILIKYTFGGDANLDGQVDVTDLGALATNWQTSSVWTGGDFNYDGFVDITDLGMLATNWQAGTSSPLGRSFADALSQLGLPVSVPEPGIVPLAMLVCVAGSILNRSRARWSQIKETR